MANIDRPNGFKASKTLTGDSVVNMMRKYDAADRSADLTNNHGDIYLGDPVTLVAGKVQVANSGDTILGVAVASGNADDVQHGQQGYFNASNLETRFLAYDENGQVAVIPAEDHLFEIQTSVDLDLVPGSQADFNIAAATTHGDRVTSRSTTELVVAANNDVMVVEQIEDPTNDSTLANARHLVRFVTTQNA
jgi:hypothetical protein